MLGLKISLAMLCWSAFTATKYYHALEDQDAKEHKALLAFTKPWNIDHTAIVFQNICGKSAVFVTEDKKDSYASNEILRFSCYYVCKEGAKKCYRNRLTFFMGFQSFPQGITPALFFKMRQDDEGFRNLLSYYPKTHERAEPFVPAISIKKTGELCHIYCGQGSVISSSGEKKTYEANFYIKKCPYSMGLSVVFMKKCVWLSKRTAGQSILYGHDVLRMPKAVSLLAHQKHQVTSECKQKIVLASTGHRDLEVELFMSNSSLQPREYNLVAITRCGFDGRAEDQWLIKHHRECEGQEQLVLYYHGKILSKFDIVSTNAGPIDRSIQTFDATWVTIRFGGHVRSSATTSADIDHWLKIINNQGEPHIEALTVCMVSTLLQRGKIKQQKEKEPLYPLSLHRTSRSKFLDYTMPLEALL